MKKVAICLISTGKYDVYVQPLIDSIKEFFLLRHKVEIHLFTDKIKSYTGDERVTIIEHSCESYRFPYATLYRYKLMTSVEITCDYLYYMDVDMKVVNKVGNEIFGDIVAVGHPGYSVVGGGAWCNNQASLAYTPEKDRKMYVAGGFQGGNRVFIEAMKTMKENIDVDKKNGVLAEWHDESHWNKYVSKHPHKLLHSGYCMVENNTQRKLWKIDKLTPYILALDKNHKEMRS